MLTLYFCLKKIKVKFLGKTMKNKSNLANIMYIIDATIDTINPLE